MSLKTKEQREKDAAAMREVNSNKLTSRQRKFAMNVHKGMSDLEAALHPLAVILLEAEQKDFVPEDQLVGKKPLDPEFVTVTTVKKVECAIS